MALCLGLFDPFINLSGIWRTDHPSDQPESIGSTPNFFLFLRQHPLKRRGRLTERPVLPTPSWHKLRGSFTAWPALHYIWPLKGPWTFKNTWSIQVWAHHHILRVLLLFAGERIFSIKTSRNNGTPNHCDRLWVIAHSSFSHEAYWWSLSSFDQYWQFLFHEALLAGYKTCSWDRPCQTLLSSTSTCV